MQTAPGGASATLELGTFLFVKVHESTQQAQNMHTTS